MYDYFMSLSDDELEEKMRQMIRISKSLPLYKEDPNFRRQVLEMERQTASFSDAVAKEISVKLMAEIEMDAKFAEADIAYDNMRQELIKGVNDNPENKDLRAMAERIMQIEKDHDQYDAENWKGMPGF